MSETNPWQVLAARQMYDNNWIQVTEYDVINPNGGKGIYGKVHFKNIAIGVVVLDEQMNTYLVGQFRFPLGEYSWEIPEGGGSLNIDPLDSAKRELLEETGLVANNWQLILKCICPILYRMSMRFFTWPAGLNSMRQCPKKPSNWQ
jgi:hypothetical protein